MNESIEMDLVTPSTSQDEFGVDVAEPRVTVNLPADRVGEPCNGGARVVRRSAWSRDLLMLIRRSHLYAGLLMLPWVLLYGVTGLLFNHPTWFSDQMIIPFGGTETKGTAMEGFPKASSVARELVAAINASTGGGYKLVKPSEARFERGGLSGNVLQDGKPYSVTFDPTNGRGMARAGGAAAGQGGSTPARPQERPDRDGERGRGKTARGELASTGDGQNALAALGRFELKGASLERLRLGLPEVLERAGLPGATVSEVRAAPLSFLVEGHGERWRANYDLQSGAISGKPAGEAGAGAELSTRRFLLRLHQSHGYPSEFNARWTWAAVSDGMSLIMIFWGLSGMVLWWQIKRTRRLGSAALAVSVLAASWVFIEMHAMLLTGGR